MLLTEKQGQHISREAVLSRLIEMLYERNDMNFSRGRFRVRVTSSKCIPVPPDEEGVRIEFFGDELRRITKFDPLTGTHTSRCPDTFYPAKAISYTCDKLNRALAHDREELEQRIVELECKTNSWKRTPGGCARNTTWKCCRKWGSATASRILAPFVRAPAWLQSRTRSSTFFQKIFS